MTPCKTGSPDKLYLLQSKRCGRVRSPTGQQSSPWLPCHVPPSKSLRAAAGRDWAGGDPAHRQALLPGWLWKEDGWERWETSPSPCLGRRISRQTPVRRSGALGFLSMGKQIVPETAGFFSGKQCSPSQRLCARQVIVLPCLNKSLMGEITHAHLKCNVIKRLWDRS